MGPRLKTITGAAQGGPSSLLVAPWRTKAQSGQPWRASSIRSRSLTSHRREGGPPTLAPPALSFAKVASPTETQQELVGSWAPRPSYVAVSSVQETAFCLQDLP